MRTRCVIQLTLAVIIITFSIVLRLHCDNLKTYVYDYLSYLMAALFLAFLLCVLKDRIRFRYGMLWIFVFVIMMPILLFAQDSYEHEIILKIAGSLTGFVSAYTLDTVIMYMDSRRQK